MLDFIRSLFGGEQGDIDGSNAKLRSAWNREWTDLKAEEKQLAITHQILPGMLHSPTREPESLLSLPEETTRNP